MPAEETMDPQPQAQPQGFAYTPPQPSAGPMGGGMSINGAAIELKVVKPTEFKDGPAIADHLLSTRTVVLNLEDADKDTARRLIDFLFGVAYSIGGEIKKVANNAYVITPQNVAISNDKNGAAAPQPQQPVENNQGNGYFGY
ncbi:MAG: cell division protein SepF [Clostridia bacterium]|nr:cell division protein SepF [Clostridia bacterium]